MSEATRPSAESGRGEAQGEAQEAEQTPEPTFTCLHCGETDLDASSMEPLQDGTPSNMCKECWANYKAARAAEFISLLKKWHQDVKNEEAEARRREAEKRLSKSEKAKVESGKHSLSLVK